MIKSKQDLRAYMAEVVRVVEGRVPWSPNNPNMT